jgi:hypothetical protein
MTNVVRIRPLNGRLKQTPVQLGQALAERLWGIPPAAFLSELDEILDHMREAMLAAGRAAPVALLICREIRHHARHRHHQLLEQEGAANDR